MLLRTSMMALALSLAGCNSYGTVQDASAGEQAAENGAGAKATTNAPFVDGQLILRFQDGLGQDQIIGLVTRNGDSVLRYEIGSNGSVLIEITSGHSVLDAVHLYTEMPEVEYAEPNYVREERGDNPR